MTKRFGLSSNQLKLLAAAFMVIDHIGFYLFPSLMVLRIIGRLSFPIFAYFISEGCRYTRNRLRYLGLMAACAVIAEIVFAIAANIGVQGIDYFSIFTTFTLGIIAAYLYSDYEQGVKEADWQRAGLSLAALTVYMFAITYISFYVRTYEYGVGGVLIILFAYAFKNKFIKLIGCAVGCLASTVTSTWPLIQIYCLLAVPVLALYGGRRGKLRMKYFFYIFYPAHIVIIILIGLII